MILNTKYASQAQDIAARLIEEVWPDETIPWEDLIKSDSFAGEFDDVLIDTVEMFNHFGYRIPDGFVSKIRSVEFEYARSAPFVESLLEKNLGFAGIE